MQDFRNLTVWEKAHGLVLEIYRASRTFPREEQFGLTSQLRRSVSSIGANIAEGCGRTQAEFVHYLQVAFGSASEAEYHLLLARDLGYLQMDNHNRMTAELQQIKRMLTSLSKTIQLGGGRSHARNDSKGQRQHTTTGIRGSRKADG
jgi:four helix bundle protein